MQGIRDSLRMVVLTVLVAVLAIALLWILLRQLLVIVGLIAVALLALRPAFGGSGGGRQVVDGCASCGREIPGEARICPYCFELRAGG